MSNKTFAFIAGLAFLSALAWLSTLKGKESWVPKLVNREAYVSDQTASQSNTQVSEPVAEKPKPTATPVPEPPKKCERDWPRLKKIHDSQMDRQMERIQEFSTNQAAPDGRTLWQKTWEPTLVCEYERRLGALGDGGKWVCDPDDIDQSNCIVYSIGSNNQFDFEESIHEALPGCKLFTFDHTVAHPHPPPYVHYVSKGLGQQTSGNFWDFDTIRRELNHTNRDIDILKIDIEQGEWSVFSDDFISKLPPINQILIELHYPRNNPGAHRINHFFVAMNNAGYVIFHKEPNIQYAGGDCTEFAFLKAPPGFTKQYSLNF